MKASPGHNVRGDRGIRYAEPPGRLDRDHMQQYKGLQTLKEAWNRRREDHGLVSVEKDPKAQLGHLGPYKNGPESGTLRFTAHLEGTIVPTFVQRRVAVGLICWIA